MADEMLFENRAAFRAWLAENTGHEGLWLIFGKKGGPKTLTAAQALEEALCFGWIDGQMESIDDIRYRKYFSPRRAKSRWSDKNKALIDKLEAAGLMTDHGRRKIEAAKADGSWDAPKGLVITEEDVETLKARLKPHDLAYRNFIAMTPSVQRTYTGFSMDVKTEAGREKRFNQLVERLELNLNPMESLKKAKK